VHDQNVEVNVVAIVAEIVIGAGVIARENDPAVVIEETETGKEKQFQMEFFECYVLLIFIKLIPGSFPLAI
jgi:hypothetical protein